MMRKTIKVIWTISTVILICGLGVAHALDTKTTKSQNLKLKVKGNITVLPLTENECTDLGGEVNSDNGSGICNSGKYCGTIDQNGHKHRVCISAQ